MSKAVTLSPFRSPVEQERVEATLAMITKREAEILALRVVLDAAPKRDRRLEARRRSLQKNLRSWHLYYAALGHPVEPRATIVP